jgi:hypothetical protein
MEVEKRFEYKEEEDVTTSGSSQEEHFHRQEENALHMETQGIIHSKYY